MDFSQRGEVREGLSTSFFPPERLKKNDDPGKIVKATSYLTKLFLVKGAGMRAAKKCFWRSFAFLRRIILKPNFSREISSIRQLGCCDSLSCRSRRLSASSATLFGFDRAIGDSFALCFARRALRRRPKLLSKFVVALRQILYFNAI
jgi:hypothetical protein